MYVAKVEVKGIAKKAESSFFSKTWTKSDVVNAVNEAYINKIPTGKPNQFEGISSFGVKIQIYLKPDETIATAYPLYGK